MKTFLTSFLVLSPLFLTAAASLGDLAFFTEKDTIKCNILLKSNAKNAVKITFIDAHGSKQEKNADEIFGYKTEDGDLFLSKNVNIDGTRDMRFCQIFTQGFAVLFTTFTDYGNELRFIEKEGLETIEITEGKESNILNYFFDDCDQLSHEEIVRANPKKIQNLTKLVLKYSNCAGPAQANEIVADFKKSKIKIHPGLLIGFENASLKNIRKDIAFGSDNSFVVGINAELTFGNRLSFIPAITYTNKEFLIERPNPLYPSLTFHESMYMSSSQFEIGIRYYLNFASSRFYAGFTPTFSIFSDIHLERQLTNDIGEEYFIKNTYAEYYTLGAKMVLGVSYGSGKLRPFSEIVYVYNQVSPKPHPIEQDDFLLNSIQILVGVSF